MNLILISLYLVMVLLNLLDGLSTWLFVKPDHYQREANPLARWIFLRLGITRGIILSELAWIGCFSLAFFLFWQNPSLQLPLLLLLSLGVLVFAWIVTGNIRYCLRLNVFRSNPAKNSSDQ